MFGFQEKKHSNFASLKRQPKGMGIIQSSLSDPCPALDSFSLHPRFKPFVFNGVCIAPQEPQGDSIRLNIIGQSIILTSTLPFSNKSACGSSVELCGIEMGCVPRPLHKVRIQSKLVSSVFPVTICPALSICDVTMVVGNDIAGVGWFLPLTLWTLRSAKRGVVTG